MKKITIGLFLFIICFFKCFVYSEEISFDTMNYNNIEFYILSEDNETYTLLKKTPLTVDEVNKYGHKQINKNKSYLASGVAQNCNGFGCITFCTRNDECNNDFKNSDVKIVIDNWVNAEIGVDVLVPDTTGYGARMLTVDELKNKFGFIYASTSPSTFGYTYSEDTPKWFLVKNNGVYDSWLSSWTISAVDSSDSLYYIYSGNLLESSAGQSQAIVWPVINLSKNYQSINDSKKVINKEYDSPVSGSYKKGDIINIKGIKFYVLNDSSKDDENITLLKAEPLTKEEVESSGGNDINKYALDPDDVRNDSYGVIAYYTSETCGNVNEKSVSLGCTNEYKKSEIKIIVDNWTSKTFDKSELGIDKYGYSSRIINEDDLINSLYYTNPKGEATYNADYLIPSIYSPNYVLARCWTMVMIEDYNELVSVEGDSNNFYANFVYFKNGTVCPVVTLRKQNNQSNEQSNLVVQVADTLSNEPFVSTVVGSILLLIITITYLIIRKKITKY